MEAFSATNTDLDLNPLIRNTISTTRTWTDSNKVGAVDELAQSASNVGKQIENWQGVDFDVNARLRNGLTVQGGTSSGRRLAKPGAWSPTPKVQKRGRTRGVRPFLCTPSKSTDEEPGSRPADGASRMFFCSTVRPVWGPVNIAGGVRQCPARRAQR